MFCTNCGAKVASDDRFCTKCGNHIDPAGMADEASSAPVAPQQVKDPTGNFIVAGIAAGVGGIATYATYSAAGPGESFFIVWGPTLFGGWKFIQGVILLIGQHASRTPQTIGLASVAAVVLALAGASLAYTVANGDWSSSNDGGGTTSNGLQESQASLNPGDCIKDPGAAEVKDLESVSCGQAGALEVTNTFDITGYVSYPTSSEIDDLAADRCSSSASTFIHPTRESWAANDRLVICLK
jgi:zinc-ribbon domain